MDVSPHAVLIAICEKYDTVDEPVDPQQIATAVGTTPRQVRPILKSLRRTEFVAETAEGYRPTVTAREFLELEIKLFDVAVLEVVEEGSGK